ncbi:MAG TPA: TonB-dependent receptor [Steroidobacteraceae bacterium]|jgi:iron complex outermembrane receptor protein
MNWIVRIAAGEQLVVSLVVGILAFAGMSAVPAAHASPAGSPGPADATPADASTTAAGPNTEAQVAEVVVTARRTQEKLKDVPVAVTALSAEALAEQHIDTQADLQFATPGLVVRATGSSDQLNYSLRGQSVDSFSFAAPAVVAYFNEVPTGGAAAQAFFDMDSIQVLKGPQGTLFGRNATGGAVLYTSKRPSDDFDAYAKVSYGSYDDRMIEAALNAPLADGIDLRVSGKTESRRGFQHNLLLNTWVNDIDSRVGRVSLLIAPKDTPFSNLTMFQHGDFGGFTGQDKIVNANGVNGAPSTYFDPLTGTIKPLVLNTALSYPPGVVSIYPQVNNLFNGIGDFLNKQKNIGFYDFYSSASDARHGTQSVATNTTTLALGDTAQVKNIFGYNRVIQQEQSDISGSPYDFLEVGGGPGPNDKGYTFGTNQWSEELQANGKVQRLNYIVGLFFSKEDTYDRIPLTVTPDLGAPYLGAYDFTVTDKSKAVYGQVGYALLDNLNVNGGVRYTWEEVSILQGGDSLLNVLNGGDHSRKDSKPSWLIGLDYKLTQELMVYFNQRGSWRTGGFNGTSAASFPNAATFSPETTYDFELGAKYAGLVAGLPVSVDIALFDQHIKDVQRAPYLNISALAGNVNKAEVAGVEFQSRVKLVRWLDVGLSGTYTNARYTDPNATVAGAQFYFGPYADTPKVSGSAYFRASAELPSGKGELALRPEIYAQDYFFYSNLNDTIVPGCRIGGYALVNVRAEWNGMLGSKLDAAFYANNATNKEYNTGGFPLGAVTGSNSVLPGTPRMYGIELATRF